MKKMTVGKKKKRPLNEEGEQRSRSRNLEEQRDKDRNLTSAAESTRPAWAQVQLFKSNHTLQQPIHSLNYRQIQEATIRLYNTESYIHSALT